MNPEMRITLTQFLIEERRRFPGATAAPETLRRLLLLSLREKLPSHPVN